MFRKRKQEPQARQAAKPAVKLTAAEKREIRRILETARGDGKPHSAQDTIPFRQMYPDGLAFNLLVLVGAIKGCDRIVKEIMGL